MSHKYPFDFALTTYQMWIISAALAHYDEALANSDGDALGWDKPDPPPTDLEVRAVREILKDMWP